jgi:hypothetical protein
VGLQTDIGASHGSRIGRPSATRLLASGPHQARTGRVRGDSVRVVRWYRVGADALRRALAG